MNVAPHTDEGAIRRKWRGKPKLALDQKFFTEPNLRVKLLGLEIEDRVIQFTISTADTDRDGDVIDPAGWDLRNYLKNPVVLWAHDSWSQPPVGKCVKIWVEDGALKAQVQFSKSEFGEQVYQAVKAGELCATSVGFRPLEYEWLQGDAIENDGQAFIGPSGMHFLKQELLEFSIVPIPSNPNALAEERTKMAKLITKKPAPAGDDSAKPADDTLAEHLQTYKALLEKHEGVVKAHQEQVDAIAGHTKALGENADALGKCVKDITAALESSGDGGDGDGGKGLLAYLLKDSEMEEGEPAGTGGTLVLHGEHEKRIKSAHAALSKVLAGHYAAMGHPPESDGKPADGDGGADDGDDGPDDKAIEAIVAKFNESLDGQFKAALTAMTGRL